MNQQQEDIELGVIKDEERQPWRYIGYKVFSRWMASDPTFFIVRRFGALNARVALALQDEIAELEEELLQKDKEHTDSGVHNGSFRGDLPDREDRLNLVRNRLREKLTNYNVFLNGYAELVSRGSVNPDDVVSVRSWLQKIRPGAIDGDESAYIKHDDDLVPIHPKTRSWLRNALERTVFLTPRLKGFFSRQPPIDDDVPLTNESTIWPNDQRMETLSYGLVSLIGLSMLIGPLWILAYVHLVAYRLTVITAFILVFSGLITVATTARVFEALAAAAAYSAVLVVFLQSGVGVDRQNSSGD